MLEKILIGTANFIKPYGILSRGHCLDPMVVRQIIEISKKNNLRGLDTALAYGDLFSVISSQNSDELQVITKISVLERPQDTIKILKQQKQKFYAILIHDPQNLNNVNYQIKNLISSLKDEFDSPKVGVSVYNEDEVIEFSQHYVPEIIQIPLNPFNQSFNNESFKKMIEYNMIEIHARSLFLQGILLEKSLPKKLEVLSPYLEKFHQQIGHTCSPLNALLEWAQSLKWIDAWVLGVASAQQLEEIIYILSSLSTVQCTNPLGNFEAVNHALVNPKNWNN